VSWLSGLLYSQHPVKLINAQEERKPPVTSSKRGEISINRAAPHYHVW